MIPHTGVIVYGQEFFFGGGIQVMPHAQFVAMQGQPAQLLDMGTTEIPREVFEEFLEAARPRFTVATYDLLTNNCNNFSNEACQFLVGRSIPEGRRGTHFLFFTLLFFLDLVSHPLSSIVNIKICQWASRYHRPSSSCSLHAHWGDAEAAS